MVSQNSEVFDTCTLETKLSVHSNVLRREEG